MNLSSFLHAVEWFQVLLYNRQFNISHLFAHSLFYLTPAGGATLGWSRPGSNGNEGILHIPQISKVEATLSDGLMPYPGHLLGEEGSAKIQSVYFSSPANWASSCV